MRLHRLELEGFGPYRAAQTVDFDAFADDGIFLITGPTGAGKSSVLDGVCFALYGSVPRFDKADKRLRSDHCTIDDDTRVTLEFSSGDDRYRLTRSPEYTRAKKRGEGTTVVAPEANLDKWHRDTWVGCAAGARAVGIELDEVLGLSQQQFLQVILLAQNRFSKFLHADNDERQKLLRRLFGTRSYLEYQEAFDTRRRDAERALGEASVGIDLILDTAERTLAADGLLAPADVDSPEIAAEAGGMDGVQSVTTADGTNRTEDSDRFALLERGRDRARYRAQTLQLERDNADAAHSAAERAHGEAAALHEAQQRRLRARTALAELEAAADGVDADRRELARAATAESLRAYLELAETAETAAVKARAAVDAATDAWLDAATSDIDSRDATALQHHADTLTGKIALWQEAAVRERGLDSGRSRVRTLTETITATRSALEALDSDVAGFPGRRARIDEALQRLSASPDLESARERERELAERVQAAREAERLAAETASAEAAYLTAAALLDDARAKVTALLHRRLAGYAGELAAGLIDGRACAVCGATEHPDPAPVSDASVTDEQLSAAERDRDAATTADAEASAVARESREAHARARARAGDQSASDAEAAHTHAQAQVEAATRAAQQREELGVQRRELDTAAQTMQAERDRVLAELATLGKELATANQSVEQAQRVVAQARGTHPSVAERVARAIAERDTAAALADALTAAARAADEAERAARERDTRLAATDFAEPTDAMAALRDEPTRAGLDAGVRNHDTALRAERDRLRDLELALAGQPAQPVDVSITRLALAAARDAWSGAVDRAAHAAQTAVTVADLLAQAEAQRQTRRTLAQAHAAISRLADTVAGRAPNTHRMTLESFVLAAELEQIAAAANVRLAEFSNCRYQLVHTDARAARGAASGLGLEVLDAHTGMARPVQSLSGGETFLASLALALGLAEVVTARAGGIRMDTLFIDEGFGQLDADSLELAMRTLDDLRQGGRTVGIISHVDAMKEQIPAQLRISVSADGPSLIGRADTAQRA